MTIVLLPPSESKTTASGTTKLNVETLSFSELNPLREKTLASLLALSNGAASKARKVLGVSAKQDWEIERNKELLSAPVAPAWQVYTGVLFEAIGFERLNATHIKKLSNLTYVQSALFGLISLADYIPAYRLSGDCSLPKLGTLTSVWAKPCSEILKQSDELIIDMRSGTYVKLGPLPFDSQAVVPKILQRMPSGPPKVVSHHNKATKGRILRAMAQAKGTVKGIDEFANVVASLGADVVVRKPTRVGGPLTLEVVVDVL